MAEKDTAAPPANGAKSAAVEMLEAHLEQARAGKVTAVVIAAVGEGNATTILSTPMPPWMLNHIWRQFDDKVREAYAQARARAQASRSPTASVRENPAGAKVQATVKAQLATNRQRKKAKKAAARAVSSALS